MLLESLVDELVLVEVLLRLADDVRRVAQLEDAANAGFRSLPVGGRVGPVPVWPLADDVRRVAQLEDARDRVLDLQVRLEAESDARVKGRLRRDLSKYQLVAATVELQLEQARDAEVALWGELWRMPQAVMWEESSAGREVAQYVRWKIRGEQGSVLFLKRPYQLFPVPWMPESVQTFFGI